MANREWGASVVIIKGTKGQKDGHTDNTGHDHNDKWEYPWNNIPLWSTTCGSCLLVDRLVGWLVDHRTQPPPPTLSISWHTKYTHGHHRIIIIIISHAKLKPQSAICTSAACWGKCCGLYCCPTDRHRSNGQRAAAVAAFVVVTVLLVVSRWPDRRPHNRPWTPQQQHKRQLASPTTHTNIGKVMQKSIRIGVNISIQPKAIWAGINSHTTTTGDFTSASSRYRTQVTWWWVKGRRERKSVGMYIKPNRILFLLCEHLFIIYSIPTENERRTGWTKATDNVLGISQDQWRLCVAVLGHWNQFTANRPQFEAPFPKAQHSIEEWRRKSMGGGSWKYNC